MSRTITQRELRNDSGAIMRGLDEGESFIVTRNGVPVGQLTSVGPRRFVGVATVRRAFAGAAPVNAERFRKDVDTGIDQDVEPRA